MGRPIICPTESLSACGGSVVGILIVIVLGVVTWQNVVGRDAEVLQCELLQLSVEMCPCMECGEGIG
jgi:hypothetical protein